MGHLRDVAPGTAQDAQIGMLLAMLEDGTREWRDELIWRPSGRADPSEEKILWQPFPNGHSIGGLILHIAGVEIYWLHYLACGYKPSQEEQSLLMAEEIDVDRVYWPTPPRRPLEWYFDQHDRIRARTHALISALDDPAREYDWHDGRVTLRWMLHHVVSHEAYHGGQAVLLALQYEATAGRAG